MHIPEYSLLPQCLPRDRIHLRRRLRQLDRTNQEQLLAFQTDLTQAIARRTLRLNNLPKPLFPLPLPVVERKTEIAAAIQKHPIIILCGETGSGKTTQLPKICLELGRGVDGIIGVTQPRRIAARTVADFISRELQGEVGETVGYKIRFTDKSNPERTYVKVMTDGILLAETQADPFLNAYDTLILDEAHERSLNIDFLLGFLKQLLPKRPELKLIVSSATLDTEKFSQHFNQAPIIEVSGRTYPVEVRYRPLESESGENDPLTLEQGILAATDELSRLEPGGDILIFLPGEREIRETAEALRKHHPPHTEILPLYARLSAAEQNRVFQPPTHRRIVLATNVAETSLTVPGIRSVVDAGVARIGRYSGRTQVQRLQIEKISQASADQRKGRCGRLGPGVCVRLYSQDDYLARPGYTDPEVLRSSLAGVILRMKSLKLGDVAQFPFVDPPHPRAIREGVRLLTELGALDDKENLTPLGQQLAALPVDPRIGRMILAAVTRNALSETLIIAAALSINDPREEPAERREAARLSHRQYQEPGSDFITLLNLWGALKQLQESTKSKNRFREEVRSRFLSYVRVLEWFDIHQQLDRMVREMGFRPNQVPATPTELHQALLTGLAGGIGFKAEKHEYTGTRQNRFSLHPGSGLFKAAPKWVMAAELVETTRLYARVVAGIEPEWIEACLAPLCRKSYSDPHWDKKAGAVMAWEQVTLHGLVVVPRRRVNYGPIDALEARTIFIRSALVGGELATSLPFHHHNQRLLQEVRELEQKSRRRDLLVDDDTLATWFDARVPPEIHAARGLEAWWREQKGQKPLFLDRGDVIRAESLRIHEEDFPGHIVVNGLEIALEYHFNPGQGGDGVTAVIPLSLLNQVEPAPFEWLVPGLWREKVTALCKGLAQSWRRYLVPVPNTVDQCLEPMTFRQGSLYLALSDVLKRLKGVAIPLEAWRPGELPDHLRMNFRVRDDTTDRVLAEGRDFLQLRAGLTQEARESFQTLPKAGCERERVTQWDFGPLAERVTLQAGGKSLVGYPALVDDGGGVAVKVLDTPEAARQSHRQGLARLYLLQLPQQVKQVRKSPPINPKAMVVASRWGGGEALKEALLLAAAEAVFVGETGEPRDEATFQARLQAGRGRFTITLDGLGQLMTRILLAYDLLEKTLKSPTLTPAQRALIPGFREHLEHLLPMGFFLHTPPMWRERLPVYLEAMSQRLAKAATTPARDKERAGEVEPLWRQFLMKEKRNREMGVWDEELQLYGWMLEEFRVSLFAQELKTLFPVSANRLFKQWEKVIG